MRVDSSVKIDSISLQPNSHRKLKLEPKHDSRLMKKSSMPTHLTTRTDQTRSHKKNGSLLVDTGKQNDDLKNVLIPPRTRNR